MARDSDRDRSSRRHREDADRDGDRQRHHRDDTDDPRRSEDDGRRRLPPSSDPQEDADTGRESAERGEDMRKAKAEGRLRSPEDRDRGRDSPERGDGRRRTRDGRRRSSPDQPEDCERERDLAERGEERRKKRDGFLRDPDRARGSTERGEEKPRSRDDSQRRSPEGRDRRRESVDRGEKKQKDDGGQRRSQGDCDRRRESAERGEAKSKDKGRRRSPDGRERMRESSEGREERAKDVGRRRSPEGRERRREEEKRGTADYGQREHHKSREKELVENNDKRREHQRSKGSESVERGRSPSREESVEERLTLKKRKEHGREGENREGPGEKRMRVLTDGDDERWELRREDYGMKERGEREERKEEERKSKGERKGRSRERDPDDREVEKHMRALVEDEDTRRDDNRMEEKEAERRTKDERRKKRRGFKEEVKEEQWTDGDGRGDSRLCENVREEGGGARKESREAKRLKVEVKDEVKDEVFVDGDDAEVKMSRRRNHGKLEVDGDAGLGDGCGSGAKDFAPDPVREALETVQNSYAVSSMSVPSKVSSVTTTIENGLINRADEVHGKSSTDGATTSLPGKSGSLSLDALAKAKKALQMQKMLSEKLKKIPMISKPGSGADGDSQMDTMKGTQKISLFTGMPSTAKSAEGYSGSSNNSGVASASSTKPSDATVGLPSLSGLNVEAVKRAQEVAARMGFRQDPQFAPLINMFPGTVADAAIPQKPSKAPVLRLDAQGREVDEHGNVINMPKLTNLSTLKVNINKQKKEAFQILKPDLDANLEANPFFDRGLGINKSKLLRPKRPSFQFVEEGKWSRQAEITRFKNQFGEAQAKELKTKQAQLAKAKAEPDINPNLIELSERVIIKEKHKELIPDVEWWDTPFLPSGKYDDVTDDKMNLEKITIYVEHPLPVQPPAEPAPPPPQPLKLTKKETKKLRTQRRLAKERDKQEMIRQGLLEPPKPKVKMSNLMKVLGSEATQDPTKVEMEIRSAAAEREQAHIDRNIARKLTPSERREKKEKKLFDDPNTLETFVTVYKVNSLAHPKARFQVDVNAQENKLTGCAVISDGICVIVVEGGRKPNKRYKNLMLKRIDWAAAAENEDDGVDNANAPANRCLLIWTGSVAKPSFNRFLIHQCRTEAAAKKVFVDAGVPHYWDLAVNFSDDAV